MENLIGNYAFPIVCCIVMAYYVKYSNDNNRTDTKEMNEKHNEEIKELNKMHSEEMLAFKNEIIQALNNNTKVIEKLEETLKNKIKEGEKNEN